MSLYLLRMSVSGAGVTLGMKVKYLEGHGTCWREGYAYLPLLEILYEKRIVL